MRIKLFCICCLVMLSAVFVGAQTKEKRSFKPISFRVVNVEPTTFITYDPFKITYRLEYLAPQNKKEVKILNNPDLNYFQGALGSPVDVDLRALKEKHKDKIAEINQMKLDSGPRIIVSNLAAGRQEVVGNKISQDFVVTLRLIRETVTAKPISVLRLEISDVSIGWAVITAGQKEGEYKHEEPVKSGKVMVNHVLTIPVHDSNLNFRSRVKVSEYSSKSAFWFFWGIPAISAGLVGLLGWALVRSFRKPVITVENAPAQMENKKSEDLSGVKRMKFKYARAELWNAVTAASENKDFGNDSGMIENLYLSLSNLLLAAMPAAPMGSLPENFTRLLDESRRQSGIDKVLYKLAGFAGELRPLYEAITGETENKNSDDEDGETGRYDELVRNIRIHARGLWWYNRIFPLKNKEQ